MAKAAPAASIEASWRAVIGCSYANSFETARVITAVNTLLGAWGAKGGALLTSSPKAGKIEDARFADPAKPEKPRVGDKEYPLALDSAGTNIAALQAALDGTMKGLFFYNSNAAKGYAQPKTWAEALGKCDLVVTIDVQMSETALQSALRAARGHVPRASGAARVHGRQEALRGHAHGRARPHPSRNEDLRRDLQRPGRGLRRGRVLPVHRRGLGCRAAGDRGRVPRTS